MCALQNMPKTETAPISVIGFDVDGTLVNHPTQKVVWQVFHQHFVGDAKYGWARYRDYKAGRITYAEWVDYDVGAWKEVAATAQQMREIIRAELSVVPNGVETLHTLHQRGYQLAIISGTLDIVIDELLTGIPFSHIFSNRLYFDGQGTLSHWEATPYDIDGKARALAHIAQQHQVSLQNCAFVGDHLNDLEVLGAAGLSIAFTPKDERLHQVADRIFDIPDLSALLELFPPCPGARYNL